MLRRNCTNGPFDTITSLFFPPPPPASDAVRDSEVLRRDQSNSVREPAPHVNLQMKFLAASLIGLTTMITPAPAQSQESESGGGINLGRAIFADTSALEVTVGLWYGSPRTGPLLEGAVGADWAIGHGTPYDILDADVGYAIGLDASEQTRLLIRAGASWRGKNDRTDGFGANGAIDLHHFMNLRWGWSLTMTWRRFSGFTAPSVTAGLILR